jgi:hypothetical protein
VAKLISELIAPVEKAVDWFVALAFWQQLLVIVVGGLFVRARDVRDTIKLCLDYRIASRKVEAENARKAVELRSKLKAIQSKNKPTTGAKK